MATTLYCISLILYMEGRNQSDITQQYLAAFALNKAEELAIPVCKTLKTKGLYSWNWDGIATKIDKKLLKEKIEPNVLAELRKKDHKLKEYKFFNVCSGKRFPGKVFKSGDICFYTGEKRGK